MENYIKDINFIDDLSIQIENILPQTQCTKCGFNGCKPYAKAIANDEANYNQCPPGGQEGVARIAKILNKPIIPLNIEHGKERKRHVAVIDINTCIGCTLCIQACPVDAIVGSAKHMHNVLSDWCTGCDLCVSPCPVDCISMQPITLNSGWAAWSENLAKKAKERYERRLKRLEQDKNKKQDMQKSAITAKATNLSSEIDKKAIIAAAMARAKEKLNKI